MTSTTKKELSDRVNSFLNLNPSIDFTKLCKSDLERLLEALESGKQRGSRVDVESPRILEHLGKGPIIERIKKRPLFQRILER